MNVRLVDTNIFLWYIEGDSRLPLHCREIFESEDSILYISAASIWEISIKNASGKLNLKPDLVTYLNTFLLNGDYRILPINTEHIIRSSLLPYHHRDPFDRLIYAQSIVENIPLLFTDAVFNTYLQSQA